MERFLRDWRQDALNKAQYESAIFIGDKLLAMTSRTDPPILDPPNPPLNQVRAP
jgi:anaphase-promoting complex subunit 6